MSFRDEIQQFLDGIDPKILARGKDYYRSGMIEHIEKDGGHVTAEVAGSEMEPYLVGIDIAEDGEIMEWSCDCPYDWGDVCKHTAAVLLALQAGTEEISPKKKKPEKVSVQKLVEKASREQLAALVLEHCREDKRFKGQVLSALETTGEYELASIKDLVKASIRENTCLAHPPRASTHFDLPPDHLVIYAHTSPFTAGAVGRYTGEARGCICPGIYRRPQADVLL